MSTTKGKRRRGNASAAAADKPDRNYKRKAIGMNAKLKPSNLFLSTHIGGIVSHSHPELSQGSLAELERTEGRNHFANTKQLCAILQINFDGSERAGSYAEECSAH